MGGHGENCGHLQTGNGALTRKWTGRHPDLGLPSLQNCEEQIPVVYSTQSAAVCYCSLSRLITPLPWTIPGARRPTSWWLTDTGIRKVSLLVLKRDSSAVQLWVRVPRGTRLQLTPVETPSLPDPASLHPLLPRTLARGPQALCQLAAAGRQVTGTGNCSRRAPRKAIHEGAGRCPFSCHASAK